MNRRHLLALVLLAACTAGCVAADLTARPDPMACSVIHSDGLTGSWSDCTPLGTHDEVQATAACTASTLGGCHDEVTPLGSAVCGGPAQVVCWVYSGDVDAGGRSGETIEPTPTTIGGAAVDAGQPEGWVTVGDWD